MEPRRPEPVSASGECPRTITRPRHRMPSAESRASGIPPACGRAGAHGVRTADRTPRTPPAANRPHADIKSPTRNDIERRKLLGQHCRAAQSREENSRAEPNPRRRCGDRAERGERFEPRAVRSGRLNAADDAADSPRVALGVRVLTEYDGVGFRDSIDTGGVHRTYRRQRRGPVECRLRAEHGRNIEICVDVTVTGYCPTGGPTDPPRPPPVGASGEPGDDGPSASPRSAASRSSSRRGCRPIRGAPARTRPATT